MARQTALARPGGVRGVGAVAGAQLIPVLVGDIQIEVEVAKSTAQMIDKAGAAARPDRVEVEFGLKFSANGTVIMAGVAGEASLKVTLGYDADYASRSPR